MSANVRRNLSLQITPVSSLLAAFLMTAACGGSTPETVAEASVETADQYLCIDAAGNAVDGALCGVDGQCRSGNVVIEEASCIIPTSDLVCVNSNGDPIPGGICGEDGLCRDQDGLVIEGSRCVSAPECTEQVLDFDTDADGNSILPGQDLENAYASWGIHLETWNKRQCRRSTGIAFDTSDPTGGDHDLGTPNEEFGGPGKGDGGSTNMSSLFNVLIRAENTKDRDRDGLVDDPDDHARGALFEFDFDGARCVDLVEILDVEADEVPTLITLFDGQGQVVAEIEGGGLGDNSVEQIAIEICEIHSVQIRLRSSGAISMLKLRDCEDTRPQP